MRPIRVFENDSAWPAWQVTQTFSPTKCASTGGPAALCLGGSRRRRGRCFRRGAAGAASALEKLLQRVDGVVRVGELLASLAMHRPGGAETLGEFGQFGKDRILDLTGLRGRFA